jgi:hypothetical protein
VALPALDADGLVKLRRTKEVEFRGEGAWSQFLAQHDLAGLDPGNGEARRQLCENRDQSPPACLVPLVSPLLSPHHAAVPPAPCHVPRAAGHMLTTVLCPGDLISFFDELQPSCSYIGVLRPSAGHQRVTNLVGADRCGIRAACCWPHADHCPPVPLCSCPGDVISFFDELQPSCSYIGVLRPSAQQVTNLVGADRSRTNAAEQELQMALPRVVAAAEEAAGVGEADVEVVGRREVGWVGRGGGGCRDLLGWGRQWAPYSALLAGAPSGAHAPAAGSECVVLSTPAGVRPAPARGYQHSAPAVRGGGGRRCDGQEAPGDRGARLQAACTRVHEGWCITIPILTQRAYAIAHHGLPCGPHAQVMYVASHKSKASGAPGRSPAVAKGLGRRAGMQVGRCWLVERHPPKTRSCPTRSLCGLCAGSMKELADVEDKVLAYAGMMG